MVPYEVALTAVFVEGFVFVGLTVLGIRQWLARYVNPNLAYPGLSLPCDRVVQLSPASGIVQLENGLTVHSFHLAFVY